MSLLPVENQPGLYRDTKSNAIVNSNTIEYEMTDDNVKLVVAQADGSTTIVDIPIASFAF